MKEIVADSKLVAYCGLYCGACRRYLEDKCGGCQENIKATWCKVRACCLDNQYVSCAECPKISDPNDCKLFNNFISKAFAFIFRSDRAACIRQIKDLGIQGHAEKMADLKLQSIKR